MKTNMAGRRVAKLLSVLLAAVLMIGLLPVPVAFAETAGRISGFLWADGNGMPPTGWDGLYNGDEYPIPGYTVSLYAQGDLTAALQTAQTDAAGKYIFEELEPGGYVLGVESAVAGGYEYLLPMAAAGQNKFAIDWGSDPLMSYTSPITLAAGQHAQNIDAGMRLPMGFVPAAAVTLANLGNPSATINVNDTVNIDNYNWYIVKKATVLGPNGESMNCFLLACTVIRNFNNGVTSSFGTSINYEGSLLQDRMETRHLRDSPTIKAIAVRPDLDLANPDPKNAVTTPTGVMAGSQTKDIMFAMSYKDAVDWNGAKESPLIKQLSDYGSNSVVRFWLRTPRTSAEIYGIFPYANTIDAGLHYNSQMIGEVPAVWVYGNAVNREVKVYYVDTGGNPIGPVSKTYSVVINNTFTLTSSTSDVPPISGHTYKEWKKGAAGTPSDDPFPSPTLTAAEVIAGTDIYLIYEEDTTDVTISKTVDGPYADSVKTYGFTVHLTDADGVPLPAGTQFDTDAGGTLTLLSGGYATFSLGDGQSVTIEGIPAAAEIRIVEDGQPQPGNAVTYIDSKTLVPVNHWDTGFDAVGNAARSFVFTNTRTAPPPMGVREDLRATMAMISLSALLILAGAAIYVLKRKRVWTRD